MIRVDPVLGGITWRFQGRPHAFTTTSFSLLPIVHDDGRCRYRKWLGFAIVFVRRSEVSSRG